MSQATRYIDMTGEDGVTIVDEHGNTIQTRTAGVTVQDSFGNSVTTTSTGVTVTGVSTALVQAPAATLKGTTTATVQAPTANLKGGALANVNGSLVMIGTGGAGNLNNLPTAQLTLFNNYVASGPSALVSNPLATPAAAAQTATTNVVAGLPALVAGGYITLTDQTNITAALTGAGGYSSSVTSLNNYTSVMSGTTSATSVQPTLPGLMGMANTLDGPLAGTYGSASSLLPGITAPFSTGGPALATQTTFLNGTLSGLTLGTLTPTVLISTAGGYVTSNAAITSTSLSNFNSVQAQINQGSGFLGFAGLAQNSNPAFQTVLAGVMSPSTTSTLQGVVFT